MSNLGFDWQISEYMVYCRSRQLRKKTMDSYEQGLRLFERWSQEQMGIDDVSKITEAVIRRYINDLMERGKYTFYSNDKAKDINFPDNNFCSIFTAFLITNGSQDILQPTIILKSV